MFITPKNIVITAVSLLFALFAFTMAIKPTVSESDNQILTITHEIQNNKTQWNIEEAARKQQQDIAEAAQKSADLHKKTMDNLETTNAQLREKLLELTKGTGSTTPESNQLVDAGTSGKTQPTE